MKIESSLELIVVVGGPSNHRLLGPEPRIYDLTSEDVKLLAQNEEFDVFGSGRPAPRQKEVEDLSERDGCEAEHHVPIVVMQDGGESPGQGFVLRWHPSRGRSGPSPGQSALASVEFLPWRYRIQ
jgi:hypothetical protein